MTMRPKIGEPVTRREDARLLTGKGNFSDDFNLPGQAYGYMLRSPHAHAAIKAVDIGEALQSDGVFTVLTGEDVLADGLRPAPHRPRLSSAPDVTLKSLTGHDPVMTPYFPLPADKVRYFGEGIAFVVAETLDDARDAAEKIRVEYELLPAVTQARDAQSTAQIWTMAADNLCAEADVGDAQATEEAFRHADHVVSLDTWVQRVTGVPMEPRAAVAHYDPATRRYTLYAGSGGVIRQKTELSTILGVSEDEVRVVAYDVGGNFGTRNAFYPEFALCAWASKRIGRPVKWTCERSEALATDYQGRDLTVSAELAFDNDGKFLAIRSSNLANVGAHTVTLVPLTKGAGVMSGVYDIPSAYVRIRAALTNTVPTNSYRSAGRPEAMFVLERLVDLAARKLGMDRAEIRRRNLISFEQPYYDNPLTITYETGDYSGCMDRALEMARWDSFEKRRKKAAKKGKLRGIGVANYLEITTGALRERTEITITPDGFVNYIVGTLSSGQGHETSFVQLLTDWLGVDAERVRFIQGDSDIVKYGGGTQSGRSMRMIGIVVAQATDMLINRARRIAAIAFEAPPESVDFRDGKFVTPDREAAYDLFDIAKMAVTRNDLPDDLRGPLAAICDDTVDTAGYPYGSHVCEVEVDPETGVYEIVNYCAVDDVGTCINPMILDGQTHGAITQGLGQAMSEICAYDPSSGQLLAGSFMDYAVPRADNLPSFKTYISQAPSPANRLGVRSGGEGGTTPALAVLVNALVDALNDYGIDHIEMPATSFQVWKAIQTAKRDADTTSHKAKKHKAKGKRK